MWGVDTSEQAFLKISLRKLGGKRNSLLEESEIIEHLTLKGAVSVPKFLGKGELSRDILGPEFRENCPPALPYLVTEYIVSEIDCEASDLLLSLLEQKSLGVFQGDIKPANLAFDKISGVAKILDYDQAVWLPEDIQNMNAEEFFHWTIGQDSIHPSKGWLRHFDSADLAAFQPLFNSGALDLSSTTLYRRQRTTNTTSGVYHTIESSNVFARGVRTVEQRLSILSQIDFSENEKVLDIGCNIGLLTNYLASRGCDSTGYELDPYIATAATMVGNILGSRAKFFEVDLDKHVFGEAFDTIFLFSVLHHTDDVASNARKIAESCKRVIIECRLKESGKKPDLSSGVWKNTSSWDFNSVADLVKGLEDLFPNFRLEKDFGEVDKGRRILELRKCE